MKNTQILQDIFFWRKKTQDYFANDIQHLFVATQIVPSIKQW